MGRIGNCQAAWCGLGFLFLSACTDDFEKSLSAEAKELMAVMDQTEISCSNSVQMVDAWLEINKAAKNLTDLSERTYIVNRLGQFVLTVDLMGKNEYQKSCLAGVYLQPLHIIARSMLECGLSEKVVYDYVLSGWLKYRDVCFSFGDENDFTDGNVASARRRRSYAKGMRLAFENDAAFFERNSIRLLFRGFPDDFKNRFVAVWHEKLGCHNKDHDGNCLTIKGTRDSL